MPPHKHPRRLPVVAFVGACVVLSLLLPLTVPAVMRHDPRAVPFGLGRDSDPGPDALVPRPAADPNLIAHWSFDDGIQGGMVADDSGNGKTGVAIGDPEISEEGLSGKALSLDGAGDFINVTMDTPERDFTIELWLKTADVNPDCGVFSVTNGSSHDRHFFMWNGDANNRVYNAPGFDTGYNVGDQQWHHWVLAVDWNTDLKVYIDGAQRASTATNESKFDWDAAVKIGYSQDAIERYFKGLVDEVKIYDRVLGPTEVSAISEAPLIRFTSPQNNTHVSGLAGDVPLMFDVVYFGDGGTMDRVARIKVNDTWDDMLDGSDGAFTSFYFFSDFSNNDSDTFAIEINVTNADDHTRLAILNITIDTYPPTVAVLSPTPNQAVTGDLTLVATANDTSSGIDSVTCDIVAANPPFTAYSPVSLEYNGTSEQWTYEWPIRTNAWPLGPYDLTFTFTDNAGVWTQRTVRASVDYTPPAITLLSPTNASLISGNVTIQTRVTDTGSGVRQVLIHVGNATVPGVAMTPSAGGVYSYTIPTTNYNDGALEVYVVVDNYNLLANSSHYTFYVDNTAPTGAVTGNLVLTGTAQLTLSCSDMSGLGRLAWRIDARPYHELPIAAVQNFTIISEVYPGGNHSLTVLLEDVATPANSRLLQYGITIDKLRPNVAVRNLQYGDTVPYNFTILVDAFDDNPMEVFVSVDQGPLTALAYDNASQCWCLPTAEYGAGTHYLQVVGVDVIGNRDEDVYLYVMSPAETFTMPTWGWILIIVGAAILALVAVLVSKRKKWHLRERMKHLRLPTSRKHKVKPIKRGKGGAAKKSTAKKSAGKKKSGK